MKKLFRKAMFVAVAVAMLFSLVGVVALDIPEHASAMISTFKVTDMYMGIPGVEFSMINEEADMIIHIREGTPIYFEDFVMVRDTLEEGQTLAEVLDGRKLLVTYEIVLTSYPGQTSPIIIQVLDQEIQPLPLPQVPELNGEIVVNNETINAPAPQVNEDVVMVPVRAIAEALGYDVSWNPLTEGINLGIAVELWIGRNEAHRGRMAPIELTVAPVLVESTTYVPLDFFSNVLGQTVYVFEGQVVVETNSDMLR